MNEPELSPEMKAAIREVQQEHAFVTRRDALESMRGALEGCPDVSTVTSDPRPFRSGLGVTMKNGATFRVELVVP